MLKNHRHSTYKEDKLYMRKWKRIRAVLSLLVVFSTISSLAMPAITLAREPCQLEEHRHTQECYFTEEKTLVCDLPVIVPHEHGEGCWQLSEADPEHTHDDDCYEWYKGETLMCGLEEGREHSHDDSCYALEKGELQCTFEEKPASEPVKTLICEKEEIIAHTHAELCYTEENGEKMLICTLSEVVEHQHNEECYAVGEPVLVCTLPEHSHADDVVVEEEIQPSPSVSPMETPEVEDVGGVEATPQPPANNSYTLTYRGTDYTITATYTDEAKLLEGVVLSVNEIMAGTSEYENYYAKTQQALNDEKIVYARIFDVKFMNKRNVVQPAAPVQMDIRYDNPLPVESDATAQVVHIGENGAEVIPARTETDSEGITGIAHVQEDFSAVNLNAKARTSGGSSIMAYTLIENMDHGPNKLLIDWYVYLNREWTKVGSTRTGWLAAGNLGAVSDNYDYISEAQAKSILEPYGFKSGIESRSDLAFRKIKTYGENPVYERGIYDVTGYTDGDGRVFYQLSTDKSVDSYSVFFVPNTPAGQVEDATGSENTTASKFGEAIAVYSVEVYDEKNEIYSVEEERPVIYAVNGTEVEIVVRNTKLDNTTVTWGLHRPSLLVIGEIGRVLNSKITDNNDGTSTITLTPDQQVYIVDKAIHSESEIQEIPPDPLTVDYYVYIGGSWRHIGTTHTGWTITGRQAAGKAPYDDPNYLKDTGAKPASGFAPAGEGYIRDIIRMSQVESMFGQYGFRPKYDNTFEIRNSGSSAQNNNYRIDTVGYQTKGENTIFFDTYYDSVNNVALYPLTWGTPGAGFTGYNVYYVPDGTANGNYSSLTNLVASTQPAIARKNMNYYVYLDGSWTKVGTSEYCNTGSDNPAQPDKISINRLYEYLEPYGFPEDGQVRSTELFYSTKNGYYNNSTIENGWVSLTTPGNRTAEYNIYWLPGNTTAYSNADITKVNVNESGKFYLFQVYEPSRTVYAIDEREPKIYVRHGQKGELEVRKVPSSGGHGVNDWVVKGLDRNTTLVEGTHYTRTSSTDGEHWIYTINPMTQTAIVAFPYSNGDRSLSNIYANAETNPAISNLVEDPNIQFTLHNYSTKINELLREKGLATFTGSTAGNNDSHQNLNTDPNAKYTGTQVYSASDGTINYEGVNPKQTYLSFRGAGGNAVTFSDLLDNDPFQKNHATVKRNLDVNGYPMIDVTHHGYTTSDRLSSKGFNDNDIAKWTNADGTSLDFLFGGGNTTTTTTTVSKNYSSAITDSAGNPYVLNYTDNKNTPLQIINGKYQYFSFFNAADFNTAEQKWYVRNYVERTESTSSYLTKDDYGDFLPFNSAGGKTIEGRPYNYYQEDVDYWYGMTMRTKFFMPQGGNTETGDMIFSFAGDDDVYVFVDNKLVLDIGGTHGSCTGFINFKTGLVEAYYDFNGESAGPKIQTNTVSAAQVTDPYNGQKYDRYYQTTIFDTYVAAMMEENPDMSAEQAKARLLDPQTGIFVATGEKATNTKGTVTFDVYRYKDLSTHEMDYFYMERGSSVANCNIQFNLPTLPAEGLTISKNIDYGADAPSSDDTAFYTSAEKHSFRIINAETGNVLIKSKNADYEVTTLDGKPDGSIKADGNGIFQLSAGQRVTVANISDWLTPENVSSYIVQELIPQSQHTEDTVVKITDGNSTQDMNAIPGEAVTINGVTYIPYSSQVHSISTDGEEKDYVFTPYTNQRILDKANYLNISKNTGNATVAENTTFPVTVYVNGNPVPKDTKFYTLDANGNRVGERAYIRADENGVINIKSGTAYQLGAKLIPGYTFEVKEDSPPDGWKLDKFTVDGEEKTVTEGAIGTIKSTDEKATPHTVVVHNVTAAVNIQIPLSKQFLGMDDGDAKTRTAYFIATQVEWNEDSRQYVTVATPVIDPAPNTDITCTGNTVYTKPLSFAYPTGTVDGKYIYNITETSTKGQEGEVFVDDTSVYTVEIDITMDETLGKQVAKITKLEKNGNIIELPVEGEELSALAFVNRLSQNILPETGGTGANLYTYSGVALIICAGMLLYIQKRKLRKEVN